MRTAWPQVVGVLVASVLMAACGSAGAPETAGQGSSPESPTPTTAEAPTATHTITGVVRIDEDFDTPRGGGLIPEAGTPCWSEGFGTGIPVTVSDGTGNVIATGQITAEKGEVTEFSQASGLDCALPIEIANVPETATYAFSVGARENVAVVSIDELEEAGWEADVFVRD